MNAPGPKLDDLRIKRPAAPTQGGRGGLIAAGAGLALVVAVAAWWFTRPRPLEVTTATAREIAAGPGGERTVLNASGYVVARREATVSSKVTGKVVDVLIEEGVRVEPGQVLAHLDDTNVRTSLALAQAQLDSARSGLAETRVRLAEAERDFNRQAALLQGQASSQAEYDRAEAARSALQARLTLQQSDVGVAERHVAVWHQQLDDTVIRAPFGGIVTSKNAQPGEMISPMSAGGGFTRTGICTIVDMESLEIEIDVNESYINRVTPGQPVEATLDAYPQWRIPCQVIAIIPTADRQKSTVRVRVGFERLDSRILPQMAVKVAFQEKAAAEAPATRAVSLPRAAVREQDGRTHVFVVRDGRAERRAVMLGGPPAGDAVATAGLAAGERVILDPPAALTDGAAIAEKKP
jgi:RND family efflux transporter MFP subunit